MSAPIFFSSIEGGTQKGTFLITHQTHTKKDNLKFFPWERRKLRLSLFPKCFWKVAGYKRVGWYKALSSDAHNDLERGKKSILAGQCTVCLKD